MSPATPSPVPRSVRRRLRLDEAPALARLRTSPLGLLGLAVTVGIGAGLFAIVFRWLITTFTHLFTGYEDYAAHPGAGHGHWAALGPWFVLATPVLAGLLYGPLVHLFAREARGHGVPEVMFAVSQRGGRIPTRVAAVKALASALTIGGGGSVGREGPIVQIGSALGSGLGGLVGLVESRRKVLVACGAAGGIAATFNAPLAGVIFAMELILGEFVAQAFGMVVISSVTASLIGRAAFGDTPFLALPTFTVGHWQEYVLFALLGLIGGVVGVGFIKVLYAIEDACDWAWRWPEWLRPAVGGLLLGLVLFLLPQMYGVGYPVLGGAVAGQYGIAFLLVLLVGKMVATSLTIGIGGSGGVFAPSLFIGAMLGEAFGLGVHDLAPGVTGPAGAYALIGMGAVFAGAARAPITAVIILFELTGQYSIILPMMAAIVLATGISHALSSETVYTAKLSRRGVYLDRSETLAPEAPSPGSAAVATVMVPPPIAIADTDTLADAAAHLARSRSGVLPVHDAEGRYVGIVTARVVAHALAEGRSEVDPASLVLDLVDLVAEDAPVTDALEALDRSGCAAIPVRSTDGASVVGWIDYPTALAALGH